MSTQHPKLPVATLPELTKRYWRHVLRGLVQAYQTTGQTLASPGMPVKCPDSQGLGLLAGSLACMHYTPQRPSVKALATNLISLCPEANGTWLEKWPVSGDSLDQQSWCDLQSCMMACLRQLRYLYAMIAECLEGWRNWLVTTKCMPKEKADIYLFEYLGNLVPCAGHGPLAHNTILEIISLMVLQLRETEFECRGDCLDEFLRKLTMRAEDNDVCTFNALDLQLLLHRIAYNSDVWAISTDSAKGFRTIGQVVQDRDYSSACTQMQVDAGSVIFWQLLQKDNGVQVLTLDLHLSLERLIQSGQPVNAANVQRIFFNTHDTMAMTRHSEAWCLVSTDMLPDTVHSPSQEAVAVLTESFWSQNH